MLSLLAMNRRILYFSSGNLAAIRTHIPYIHSKRLYQLINIINTQIISSLFIHKNRHYSNQMFPLLVPPGAVLTSPETVRDFVARKHPDTAGEVLVRLQKSLFGNYS